jgi:enediyne biosynthesis protein E5
MGTNSWIRTITPSLSRPMGRPAHGTNPLLGPPAGGRAWLRDFSIRPAQIALRFVCGLLCQNVCEHLASRPARSLRSALITSFSVTLLLRAIYWWIHPIAVTATIASKFLLRIRGKHLFNPANFGVLFGLILLPGAWISAGQ